MEASGETAHKTDKSPIYLKDGNFREMGDLI